MGEDPHPVGIVSPQPFRWTLTTQAQTLQHILQFHSRGDTGSSNCNQNCEGSSAGLCRHEQVRHSCRLSASHACGHLSGPFALCAADHRNFGGFPISGALPQTQSDLLCRGRPHTDAHTAAIIVQPVAQAPSIEEAVVQQTLQLHSWLAATQRPSWTLLHPSVRPLMVRECKTQCRQ